MIKNLCEIPSPSGEEKNIKEFIRNELKDFTDSYYEDVFGNLIFIKHGRGKRICIECGIDEQFLMINQNSNNVLRFSAPNFIKASDFVDKTVLFKDKTQCVITSEVSEGIKHCHLFASAKSKSVGESATLLPCFFEDDENYKAFNIKYKAPVGVLINGIKALKKNTNEIYFVFSVQKILSNRGVRALMQSGIEFDKAICIACVDDSEKGVAVVVKEQSAVITPEVKNELLYIAKSKGIPVRLMLTDENFNMKTYLAEGYGAPCGLICIPCADNSVNKNDIKSAEKLIVAMCESEAI